MKLRSVTSFVACACLIVFAAGCAKRGVVKNDEISPSAVSTGSASGQAKQAAAPMGTTQPAGPATRPGQHDATNQKGNSASQTLVPITNNAELKAAMERIYFHFDSYALTNNARASLVKDSELIKNDPTAIVRIEGNCDERGSDEYNLALGEKRAQEAREYLKTLGIPADKLTVISYGKEKPLDPGHSESAWAANRRDDLVFLHQ